jgi:hypothetical protein
MAGQPERSHFRNKSCGRFFSTLSPREGLCRAEAEQAARNPAPTQSRQRAGGEGRYASCAHTVAPKGLLERLYAWTQYDQLPYTLPSREGRMS